MRIKIENNEMFRSVGYEFKLREALREKQVLSDGLIDYEKKIASMVCDRSKAANLNEIASRGFEREKTLKKI